MTIGERHNRLRQARIRAGYERQRDVFTRYPDWKLNTYKSNENGNAPFSFESAKTYARAFGVRAEWLYSGDGPMTAPTDSVVPLVGYVGAGAEAHYYGSGDGVLDYVSRPEGANENTVSVEVRGTSLGPLFERWLIFYDDVRTPVTPDLHGRLCIVGLPDDRVLVKLIRPAAALHHFHLLSNNEEPILDQEVIWAARVRSMTPR